MEGCQLGFRVAIGPEIVRRCFQVCMEFKGKEKRRNEKKVPGKICKQVIQHSTT
jgi:hypothetical protein